MHDDCWTQRAMRESGGSFVVRLAELFLYADSVNRHIIKNSWPLYWQKYAAIGQQMKADDDAKDGDGAVVAEMFGVLNGANHA